MAPAPGPNVCIYAPVATTDWRFMIIVARAGAIFRNCGVAIILNFFASFPSLAPSKSPQVSTHARSRPKHARRRRAKMFADPFLRAERSNPVLVLCGCVQHVWMYVAAQHGLIIRLSALVAHEGGGPKKRPIPGFKSPSIFAKLPSYKLNRDHS